MGGAGSSMADTSGTGSADGNREWWPRRCVRWQMRWREGLHAIVFLQLIPRSTMYRTLVAENEQGLPVGQAGGMVLAVLNARLKQRHMLLFLFGGLFLIT